jgi:hypothetical protein
VDRDGFAVNRLGLGLAGSTGRAPRCDRSAGQPATKEQAPARRFAIDSCGDRIRFIGDTDPTARRMLEGILALEEEYAADLANLLTTLGTKKQLRGKSGAAATAARPARRPGKAKRGR